MGRRDRLAGPQKKIMFHHNPLLTMTNVVQFSEIQGTMAEFVQGKGISDSQFAASLGLSAATISNLRAGKSDLLSRETLDKVWQAVKPADWQMVPTTGYRTITAACDDARQRRRMVALVGSAGFGKTATLRDYTRRQRNVFLVESKESMKPKFFFRMLLREMGIRFEGSVFEMIERAADELSRRPHSLLIVDEAGKLSQTLLLLIHDLRNYTEDTAGIVLAGVDYFQSNLEKGVSRGKRGMEEFYSRIAVWQHLPAPTAREKRMVAEANGITDTAQIAEVQKKPNYRECFNAINNFKFSPTQNAN